MKKVKIDTKVNPSSANQCPKYTPVPPRSTPEGRVAMDAAWMHRIFANRQAMIQETNYYYSPMNRTNENMASKIVDNKSENGPCARGDPDDSPCAPVVQERSPTTNVTCGWHPNVAAKIVAMPKRPCPSVNSRVEYL